MSETPQLCTMYDIHNFGRPDTESLDFFMWHKAKMESHARVVWWCGTPNRLKIVLGGREIW